MYLIIIVLELNDLFLYTKLHFILLQINIIIAHSRRGDLETLGYNILQWLCGKLPWEKEDDNITSTMDPEEVHAQKEILLSNLSSFMHKCFPYKKEPPGKLLYFIYQI